MANLGEAVVVVGADTSTFQRDVESGIGKATQSAGASLRNLGGQMQSIGKEATLKVTAPILGIGAAAVSIQAQFEQSMNVLQQATGASAAEVKQQTRCWNSAGQGSPQQRLLLQSRRSSILLLLRV